ncbi:MAG TPA: hypothetical protein VF717_06590 [Pyrinomonadaceae bacterium]
MSEREQQEHAPLTEREPCEWCRNPVMSWNKCLHGGCKAILRHGEWVLFFPLRWGAMCRVCGQMYLEFAE